MSSLAREGRLYKQCLEKSFGGVPSCLDKEKVIVRSGCRLPCVGKKETGIFPSDN